MLPFWVSECNNRIRAHNELCRFWPSGNLKAWQKIGVTWSMASSRGEMFICSKMVQSFSVAMGGRCFLSHVKQSSEATKKGFVRFRRTFLAGLFRDRFYFCRCVLVINAKVIYRFEVIFFKEIFLQRAGSAWFCNQRFLFTPKGKNTQKRSCQWSFKQI